jgi:hypothetical protein
MLPQRERVSKLLVLADKRGNLKSVALLPVPTLRGGNAPSNIGIEPAEDDVVHEVEMPEGLTLDRPEFLDNYALEIRGDRARLVQRRSRGERK